MVSLNLARDQVELGHSEHFCNACFRLWVPIMDALERELDRQQVLNRIRDNLSYGVMTAGMSLPEDRSGIFATAARYVWEAEVEAERRRVQQVNVGRSRSLGHSHNNNEPGVVLANTMENFLPHYSPLRYALKYLRERAEADASFLEDVFYQDSFQQMVVWPFAQDYVASLRKAGWPEAWHANEASLPEDGLGRRKQFEAFRREFKRRVDAVTAAVRAYSGTLLSSGLVGLRIGDLVTAPSE